MDNEKLDVWRRNEENRGRIYGKRGRMKEEKKEKGAKSQGRRASSEEWRMQREKARNKKQPSNLKHEGYGEWTMDTSKQIANFAKQLEFHSYEQPGQTIRNLGRSPAKWMLFMWYQLVVGQTIILLVTFFFVSIKLSYVGKNVSRFIVIALLPLNSSLQFRTLVFRNTW